MKYIYAITISILLSTLLQANSVEEGKKLYKSANCQKCHLLGENFDPNSINKEGLVSKVKTKKNLLAWVSSCDNFFNIGWFPQEQKDVAAYLNATHYKLKE